MLSLYLLAGRTPFITFLSPPFKKIFIFSATSFNSLSRASLVAQAICGVIIQWGAFKRGLSAGGGSADNTSSAAPVIWPACNEAARSVSFIKAPRAVFIKYAEGFMS